MTTTFKVVEIYRNNNGSTNLDLSCIQDETNKHSTQIVNLLGFNLVGGYSTELPITITDILNQNGKNVKVEEGDTVLEINGISTRHMTLNEVYKQLRCCGNRIYLKIKSDPEYKSKFIKQSTSLDVCNTSFNNFIRNASKSCDDNINSLNSTTNTQSNLLHSGTSSNVSSTANILNLDSIDNNNSNSVGSLLINNNSNPKSSLTTLTLTNTTKEEDTSIQSNNSNTSNSPVSSNDSSSSLNNLNSTDQESTSTEHHVYDNNSILDQSGNQSMPVDLINMSTINNTGTPVLTFQIEIDDSIKKRIDEKLRECSSADSDSDSDVQIYTPKGVDLPSAQRLAKRLYYLDGFKPSDVVRHLSKKNDFSSLVAEEYLKLFNFQSLTLDAALRKFLKQFQLVGDAQEKERVLMYFAKRYVDANNTAFTDVDSCHTLTCAIMLLNTDLHDPKVQNKMTLNEFIENLKGLNNGFNFPDVLLESLYSAIKNEPLECACLDNEDMGYEDRNGVGMSGSMNGNFTLRPIGSNPFLQIPDPQTAKEYKFGWLLRKCCIDSDGKKAAFLKRSWKMFYASLRDMVLYLHKDDKVFKNNTFDNITNAIRIHHAFASVASDYKKKQFVFRLKTADWAEYLFQTSNSNELFDWVSTINLVAAMFSSPPLPGGIGSNKTFQRPLLPVSKTRYTLQEQYEYHKKHLKQLQSDLARLESAAGAFNNSNTTSTILNSKEEKYFDKDKYNYLQFEIQRYSVYANILEEKIISEQTQLQQNSNPNLIQAQSQAKPPILNPSFVLNDYNQVATTTNPAIGASIYLNGGLINGHFNHNFNDTPTKSMPSTPTHYLNQSPIKQQQQQNLHVNFNLSPTSKTNELLIQQTTIGGSMSLSPTTTTTTTTTSTNLSTTPTINSKKFNTYLD